MKILISGASGLVGSRLVSFLESNAHEVVKLIREAGTKIAGSILWDPIEGEVDAGSLEGMDAVVHLAGENIASGRWTTTKKKRIRESRILGTKYLCRMLAGLSRRPKVLISASAIGLYGDRGAEWLRENSQPGKGFLPEVCKAWEEETFAAQEAGIRVINLRIGIVLAREGGALGKMLTPFRMGLGGVIGSGQQYMSWITLDELVQVIYFGLEHEILKGPVNAVSPNPVTNLEFTKTLGKVLKRPTVFPLPAFVAKTVLGEMAEDLLLASTRVESKALKDAQYTFRHADLENALRMILGKS